MPQSMDVKRMVKEGGYTILAWALRTLVEHEQHRLAAMIIIVLCLAPRKTELENNGILAVLRNFKLSQLGRNESLQFKRTILDLAMDSAHYDKIGATLVATGWWESFNFYPRNTNPTLWNDDDIMYFTSGDRKSIDQYTHGLCDHAGSQTSRYYDHFRLVIPYVRGDVRVIGKQMDRDHKAMTKATPLANGYFEYRIPSHTVLHRMHRDLCGRTLDDVMEPGVWYDYHFRPASELDLSADYIITQ